MTTTNPTSTRPHALTGRGGGRVKTQEDDDDNDTFERRHQWLITMAPNDDKTAAAARGVQVIFVLYVLFFS